MLSSDTFRQLRETATLQAFGLFKIPLLFFVSPRVIQVSDDRCEVMIPFRKRTKNHLGSMYFGALSIGADCAGGMIAYQSIQKKKAKVSLIFKSFHADFLKRAEGNVHFSCEQGKEIRDLVEKAISSGERVEMPVQILAHVPSQGVDPVAKFTLVLSLKKKS